MHSDQFIKVMCKSNVPIHDKFEKNYDDFWSVVVRRKGQISPKFNTRLVQVKGDTEHSEPP